MMIKCSVTFVKLNIGLWQLGYHNISRRRVDR